MSIQGTLHAGGGAATVAATFAVQGGIQYVIATEQGEHITGAISDLHISDRLGSIPRKITLPDGQVFSSKENDAIDRLLKQSSKGLSLNNIVHLLETNLKVAFLALLVTAAFTYSVFRFGVPATANWVAEALPAQANEVISYNTLELLDEIVFEPTELPLAQQTEIEAYFFDDLLPKLQQHTLLDLDYKLHFRAWPSERYEQGIPNAFALPAGDIILTDQFVRLTANEEELASVLLHEIGHIQYRHSLKTVIRSGLYSGLIAVMLGDLSAVADLGVGLGAILVQSHYSRHHESEADDFSFEHMLLLDIDPQAFINIFNAMDAYIDGAHHHSKDDNEVNTELTTKPQQNKEKDQPSVFDYMASHPATTDRVAEARRFSECYRQGLTSCPHAH